MDEKKKANVRRVVIRRPSQQERQSHPEVTQARAGRQIDYTALDQNGFRERKLRHSPQDMEVGQIFVLRRVVWEQEIRSNDNKGLNANGEIVNHSPGPEFRDDASQNSGHEDTKKQT